MKKTIELTVPKIKPSADRIFLEPTDAERKTDSGIILISEEATGKPKNQNDNKKKMPRFFIVAKGKNISEDYKVGDEIFIETSHFQPPVISHVAGLSVKIHVTYEQNICGSIKKADSDLNIKIIHNK